MGAASFADLPEHGRAGLFRFFAHREGGRERRRVGGAPPHLGPPFASSTGAGGEQIHGDESGLQELLRLPAAASASLLTDATAVFAAGEAVRVNHAVRDCRDRCEATSGMWQSEQVDDLGG